MFPGALRDKSTANGFIVPLCGESCHRLGKYSAHQCRATSDRLKAFFQTKWMIEHEASVKEWRAEFYKNYIDLDDIEDEGRYQMNSLQISGRLTKDPVLRSTKSDIPVCTFRVAVKRPGTKDKTDFINCVAWRETAEFVNKYFSKGKWIECSGYVKNDTYKKNEEEVQTLVLDCKQVFFGGEKKADADASTATYANENDDGAPDGGFHELNEEDPEELPF